MSAELARTLGLCAALLALTACDRGSGNEQGGAETGEPKSIFRPEFQVEPIEALQESGKLETRVLFADGVELTEEARAELATVIASPQVSKGGRITLRGHSDSGGSDEANVRASQERAEAVRDWMVENGVAEERITVIAFGEQNPAEPNALPDGTPNEEGRAANRRVEIEVAAPAGEGAEKAPTLAETLASGQEEGDPDAEGQPAQ